MSKTYFLYQNNTNPYYNLALEEYLLTKKQDSFISVWQNEPSVIVGVNQNAIEEVNLAYTESKGIKVVRRITGGGAVYHDLNNICYTVIAPYTQKDSSYVKFAYPIIAHLNSLGVKAEFNGRNDICIGDKKISGNAQKIFGDRILQHGTLLFDTDVAVLSKSLNVNKLKIESKGIKSVKSRVTNIKEHLSGVTFNGFLQGLILSLKKGLEEYHLTEFDHQEINKLIEEKYSQYDWNIGSSPKGEITFSDRFNFGTFTLNFNVVKGKVENAKIYGDFFELKDVLEFAKKLNGLDFTKQSFVVAFSKISDYIQGANPNEITNKLFNE